jgi:ElaB/YqjD/DUF883 family membrane-anchored ribosome-binding protein
MLKTDLAALNQTVVDLSQDVKGLLAALIKEGEEKAKSSLDDRLESLRKRFDEMRGRSQRYVGAAEEQIGEHPYTSLFGAFAIGFILAKLLSMGQQR